MSEAERIEELEFELELAREELEASQGHLSRLASELESRGLGYLVWRTEYDRVEPDSAESVSQAVAQAREHLGAWLVVPEEALQMGSELDAVVNARSWGATTWRGLRALAAYARARGEGWDGGGFWEWCASGPALGWPATNKKLAMRESSLVEQNEKMLSSRVFPVSREVDPSGRIYMPAHLKVSEGGGPLAPRVYFHDDTGGSTGQVHVGMVGPHKLVPNCKTN